MYSFFGNNLGIITNASFITYFNRYYTNQKWVSVPTNLANSSFNLVDLMPVTNYQFKIWATNTYGDGPANIYVVTTLSGTFVSLFITIFHLSCEFIQSIKNCTNVGSCM